MDHVRRTREAYGESAEWHLSEVGRAVSDQVEAAADVDLLERFARDATDRGGRTLDAGCGTGRVAGFLADRGIEVYGVDVADGMIDVARREHPDVPFAVGELVRLPFATGGFDGVVAWYSIITTPTAALAPVFAELARVLAPGGSALVAFQSGDGSAVERPKAYGSDVELSLYRHDPAHLAAGLHASGFEVDDVVVRDPVHRHEDTPQAFITARR